MQRVSGIEGVKTHRYVVLKGCRERDIVRPPTPVQITPELPTVTVFYSRVARHLVGSREKQCGDDGDDLNTAVASHYRGEAVMRLSSQPYHIYIYIKKKIRFFYNNISQPPSSLDLHKIFPTPHKKRKDSVSFTIS